MKTPNRKVRRDAKLKLPEDEGGLSVAQRARVEGWLAEDGAQSCLQRLSSEMGITVSQATLYESLAFWRAEKRFSSFSRLATAQAELEAEARGGMSADAMQEAVDRNFIMLAAETEDTELYKELRMLRIADQSAKTKGRHDQLKIEQKEREMALAERKFQRDSCKLFLQWFDAETAKRIATSGASNAEKIEQLGLAMFGEDWAA